MRFDVRHRNRSLRGQDGAEYWTLMLRYPRPSRRTQQRLNVVGGISSSRAGDAHQGVSSLWHCGIFFSGVMVPFAVPAGFYSSIGGIVGAIEMCMVGLFVDISKMAWSCRIPCRSAADRQTCPLRHSHNLTFEHRVSLSSNNARISLAINHFPSSQLLRV